MKTTRPARPEQLFFASGAHPSGRVLVTASAKGVYAVMLGKSDQALLADLEAEAPEAELLPVANAAAAHLISRVITKLQGSPTRGAIALDLRGTPLQLRVWKALESIPRGQTRTYGEIARQIGAPRAVRAVASACAANRIAILIPCHRVVRQDGDPGGYRWGLERKQAILVSEGLTARKVR